MLFVLTHMCQIGSPGSAQAGSAAGRSLWTLRALCGDFTGLASHITNKAQLHVTPRVLSAFPASAVCAAKVEGREHGCGCGAGGRQVLSLA